MTKSFDANDRAAILAALDNPDAKDPIATEIAVRLEALMKVLQEAVARTDDLPRVIEFTKPATVLDEVVILLFQETVSEQFATIARSLGKDPAEMASAIEVRILDHGKQ